MPYVERDVSRDQAAAQEMVRRSGQMGVPVITVDDQVIVGFDQARLERLVSAPSAAPRLGAAVAPRPGGLLVGAVHPGTAAARAGLRAGDLIVGVDGSTVASSEQLQQRLAAPWGARRPARLLVRRDGQDLDLAVGPSG